MKRLFILAFLTLLGNSPASAASFNCNKATSDNEILICRDAWLSKLDENYSRLYKKVRASITDKKTKTRIKNEAREALLQRETSCKYYRRKCLVDWYQFGRKRLTDELRAASPQTLRKTLTPEFIYEKLSLRSFRSMDGQKVKYYCETYLKDYYPISTASFEPNKLKIDDGESVWEVEIINQDTVKISNRIYQGSYDSVSTESIYFDPGANELRIATEPNNDGVPFEITQSSDCRPFANGFDPKTSEDFPNVSELESRSVGEFPLSHHIEPRTPVQVFNSPNGQQLGQLNLLVRENEVTGNSEFRTYIYPWKPGSNMQPQLVIRGYSIAMLIFDQSGDWMNVSADPSNPAWFNIDSLPKPFANTYRTRSNVLLGASVILVKSAHRLRSEPNTNSEILQVIKTNSDVELYPLSLKGDWLKVRSISSRSDNQTEEEALDDSIHTVMEGWLKWRKSPTHQYVDVRYNLY